jgi:hypothetical protein
MTTRYPHDQEEEFDHVAAAWTVGQLRAALAGLPDHTPISVITADEPASSYAGPEQLIIDVGVHGDRVEIALEFPAGRYYRRRQR